MRLLRHLVPAAGWICLAAGVLLQTLAKDHHPGLTLYFYAMPKPCLAALAFILLVWPGTRKHLRWLAAAATVAITCWWLSASWMHGPGATTTQAGGQELKVLYWNLCRPAGLHPRMVEMVLELQPDVAAFVEPGSQAGNLTTEYERLLPGYKVQFMPRGVLLLSRVDARYKDRGKLEGAGAFARFEVTAAGSTFPFVVADVYPHVFHSREGQLQEALSHTQGRSDAVLAGDFNTPAESIFFDAYRQQYVDAFEAAGRGPRETWPLGLPLLCLDYVWVGKDWEVTEARKLYRLTGSDHAALLVTLRRR